MKFWSEWLKEENVEKYCNLGKSFYLTFVIYIYVFSQYFSDIIFKPKNSKKLKKNMTSNHEIYNNKKSLVNCFAVRAEKFFFLKLQMKVL